MIVVNIVAPFLLGVFTIVYEVQLYNQNTVPDKVIAILFSLCELFVGIMPVVSSVFLMFALYGIKKCLDEGVEQQYVNLQMLIIHGLAFLIFLVAYLVYLGFASLEALCPTCGKHIFYWSWIIFTIMDFTSQCL